MKRLYALLTKKPVPSLLRVLALIGAIWFIFPYISVGGWTPFLDDSVTWGASIAVVAIWLGWQVFQYWTQKRRNQKIVEGLMTPPSRAAGGGADARAAEQLDQLKKRLEEALDHLGRLRKRKGLWRQNYLYELPWYILIGPPGSGKSTALRASGLRFVFENDPGDLEVKGIGGTRNCDWVFTDEAVLLDTAGRYVTQDSEPESDRAAWLGFLKLLKTHRPRQPINGIFVVVSVHDLLQQSDGECIQHARKIRERANELYSNLAIRAPVYVVFTKCDLIAGFSEYFGNLGQDDRQQIWGMTFPLSGGKNAPGVVHRFSAEFEELERRLAARLLTRLQEELDALRRDLIYTFPQEFSVIKSVAQTFLNRVFEPNRFEEPFVLRGVYFTSGTQQGTPIDQLLGTVADGLGISHRVLPPLGGKGKSYFLQRVLTDVIFRESSLAGTDIELERRHAWIRRGAYVGTAAISALTLGVWTAGYFSNGRLVDDTLRELAQLNGDLAKATPQHTSVLNVLPALDRARSLPGGYGDDTSWLSGLRGLGLDERDKIGAGSRTAYEQLLTNVFLPRIMLSIEDALRRNAGDLDTLRETLAVYLMLGNSKRFDGDTVQRWVQADWEKHLPGTVSTEQRERLWGHLRALVTLPLGVPPRPLDPNLTAHAQNLLDQLLPVDRVYQGVKQSTAIQKLPEFRISDAAGRDAPRVFARDSMSRMVPGLFTLKGQQAFREEAEKQLREVKGEAWITGHGEDDLRPSSSQQAGIPELGERYHREYEKVWSEFIADIDSPYKPMRLY